MNEDFKNYIPTTIAFKKTSASTKTRICWDSSRNSKESASKTASLYDPIGFAAPLKVYGSYICRRALFESTGDPLKEVGEETRKLFLQYTYQVKMLETLTFSRNRHMIGRSENDVLIMCTDAGFNASMMVFYLGKQVNEELKLEFVFSIGNLYNESGIIPRNELDLIERGTRHCEKLIEWMTP